MNILKSIENVAKETPPIKGVVVAMAVESQLLVSASKPLDGALFEANRQSKLQFKYAVRRLKRASDSVQNNKFVSSIINGGVNIFAKIKKYRGTGASCSSRIDDQVGSSNISNHFAEIYSDLYNSVEHDEQFDQLCEQIDLSVGNQSLVQVDRITEELVRQALKKMKGNKADALFEMQSDCLINGPPQLVTPLTNILKTFVTRIHSFLYLGLLSSSFSQGQLR